MSFFCSTSAAPLLFQNFNVFSRKNIEVYLDRFVQEPHSMGSQAQKKLAQDLHDSLVQFGLKASLQKFESQVPNYKRAPQSSFMTATGYNVLGVLPGKANCAVIFGGHYDTKYFKDFRFVGANDGGSSTALLLELARVAKKTTFVQKSLGSCSLYFAFFDGEEAFLPQWNEGVEQLNIQDHLYGSRDFVKKNLHKKESPVLINGQKVQLVVILDMVGHRHQNLFLTSGSYENDAKKLISACKKTKIKQSPLFIEDDHLPFAQFQLNFLHIIDWTNINEWHTSQDNLEIISSTKIAQFGECLIDFLQAH